MGRVFAHHEIEDVAASVAPRARTQNCERQDQTFTA
jgi:hypothetical protein